MNFTNLAIIVGTNPLPNYVVSDYFIQTNKQLEKIWLIYSEEKGRQSGTCEYSDNLEKILSNKYTGRKIVFGKIPVSDVSNAMEIERDIKHHLLEKLDSNASVHLDYTGGTKVMCTHIHRVIYEAQAVKDKSFSYLDARNSRIIFDDETKTDDLREIIFINFNELFDLHNFEILKHDDKDKNRSEFREALEKFRELVEQDRLSKYFRTYDRDKFLNNKNNLAEKINQLNSKFRSEYKAKCEFLEVVQRIPPAYRHFNEDGSFKEPDCNEKLKYTIKFLDGDWLEYLVLDSLSKKIKESQYSISSNWEIKKNSWETNFEIDALLLKGYKPTGISCTTSSFKAICKSKGFEIILRSRQIGGSEARAILVCCADRKKVGELQEELRLETGSIGENIMVLGCEDLKEDVLTEQIINFIDN